MSALYLPQVGSLASLVVAYFARLSDEELSTADIATKWTKDPKNIAAQLQRYVDAGLLRRDGSVYGAGPQIGRIDLSPGARLQAPASASRRKTVAPPIDIGAIVFEEGFKLNASNGEGVRRADLWRAKLGTMRPGQSFTVGIEHRNTIAPAITSMRKAGAGTFATRAVDAQNIRVFCVSLGGKA